MSITLEELEELKAEAKKKVSGAQVAIMAGLVDPEVIRLPLAVLRLLDEFERLHAACLFAWQALKSLEYGGLRDATIVEAYNVLAKVVGEEEPWAFIITFSRRVGPP